MKWIAVVVAFIFVFEVCASPVSVSVAGTANTTAMGYTQGDIYTFTWIVNDGYTGSANDVFDSTQKR